MPDAPDEMTPEAFESLVGAALKVDPKGLSGKHRRQCDGVLVVRGPTDDGACELGEECRARDVRGQARLDAHRERTPRWIVEGESQS